MHPLLKSLAPEPLEDDFDGDYLWKITRRRAVAIKQLIMNSPARGGRRQHLRERGAVPRAHPAAAPGALS